MEKLNHKIGEAIAEVLNRGGDPTGQTSAMQRAEPREKERRLTKCPHGVTIGGGGVFGNPTPASVCVECKRIVDERRAESERVERETRERAERMAREAHERLHAERAAAFIPARFRGVVTFHSYQPESASERAALTAARTFATDALAGTGPLLALVGPPGVGKSHLLYAVANHFAAAGRRFYARPWYRLADELRYGGQLPGQPGRHDSYVVREYLYESPIILVDEVRPTASTAFDDTELTKLACHAYDHRLAMLVTTNVSPLAAILGDAAASRFTTITMTGRDRRG